MNALNMLFSSLVRGAGLFIRPLWPFYRSHLRPCNRRDFKIPPALLAYPDLRSPLPLPLYPSVLFQHTIQNHFAVQLDQKLKRHRFPVSIISQAVWLYHRFNHSYREGFSVK